MIRYYIIDICESIEKGEVCYLRSDLLTTTINIDWAVELIPIKAQNICKLRKNLVMKPVRKCKDML